MENKKTKIVSVIAIIALVLTLVTATYAYFQAQTGEGSQADVKIKANTVDTLTFETGSAISLSLDQTSFAQGTGNKTGSTFAKAMLTANNKTNSATEHYYMYLNISSNTFTYTQNENMPEILLTIKDGSNNEITSISGLTHKIVTDANGTNISGFDITIKRGLIKLFDNREITTTSSKTEEWNVTVTYINYDEDQSKNAGKSFNSKLIIQKEEYKITLAEYIISQYTGVQGENSIYYHDANLTNGAGDNSYRYAGGDYILTDKGKQGSKHITGNRKSAALGLIFLAHNNERTYVGDYKVLEGETYNYIIKRGTDASYKISTYNEALEKATELGFLEKNNIKNFVCFGSDLSPCPTDNLYRIIGVIDGKVKLIKWDYATSELLGQNGNYQSEEIHGDNVCFESGYRGDSNTITAYYSWNNDTTDITWNESNLNMINLNTNFINNIGSKWATKIELTSWKVGTLESTTVEETVKNVYKKEITSAINTYNSKIGLMYISDYAYAVDPIYWTYPLLNEKDYSTSYQALTGENWLYMGGRDSFITKDDSTFLGIYPDGTIDWGLESNGIRPTFFLNQSVKYISGSGTSSDPIIID